MNIEATIKDLKNYMAFSNKKENFSKEEEFIHHKNIADRIGIVITAYEKEKEKNKELESDIQQKNFEIKCLNSDIKNMYCEEGVIAILEDNFDLSREEAIQILKEE